MSRLVLMLIILVIVTTVALGFRWLGDRYPVGTDSRPQIINVQTP